MARFLSLTRLVVTVSLAACASSPTNSPRPASSDSDLITRAEISASGTATALEVISRLRPHWLRSRGTGSLQGGVRSQVVVVYLDGIRLGDLQSLRTLSVSGVRSMQWLDATRAATVLTEVGSDPVAGAIIIKTR